MIPTLRPYQFIGTPAISLLLDAIAAHCLVGELIAPGVRQLAEWAGVSEGCVSPCLRQLVRDGWIDYDGRTIMLLIAPDQCVDREGDQTVDREGDQAADRVTDQCVDRALPAQPNAAYRVSNRDRVETGRMVSIINKQQQVAVVRDFGGMQGGDKQSAGGGSRADRLQSAAEVMAELGANWKIVKDAFAARPDWTAQQVRDRWEYDQRRIVASYGRLNEGVFFTALRCGELAPTRADPTQPLDPASYAGDPAFKLGSDVSPPDEQRQRETAYHDAHWRAVALLGPGAPFREMAIVVERLVAGDSDEQALAALEQHRKAVRS